MFLRHGRQALKMGISIVLYLFISTGFATESNQSVQFLSLADIHFDPFINCQQKTPCLVIEKLRTSSSSAWPALLAAYDSNVPARRQDTSYSLLTSALAAAKKAAQTRDVKFVLVLGDFLAHDYRKYYVKYSNDKTLSGYQAFVRKTFEFLNAEFAKAFPEKSIYMVVGNNDSYRNDYVMTVGGDFFQDMAALWSRLIKNPTNQASMQRGFANAGYYAVNIQDNLRLIVLNSVLFSTKARGKNINAAAQQELNWLHNELSQAAANEQEVFIAMHIPMGVDIYASLKTRLFKLIALWKTEYSNDFQADLEQYAPIISAVFAGHLHSDWFHILTLNGIEVPVTGTPSISPIFGNNPGFKIYRYAYETAQLEDFLTYYYPLSNSRAWGIEYDFNQIYQSNCHECEAPDNVSMMQRAGSVAGFYRLFHSVNTGSAQTLQWTPYYWCAIKNSNVQGYKMCEH